MTIKIETVKDYKRGCGWRKPGGLYLIGGGEPAGCNRLPAPVHICPTCNQGIKQTRGFTWFNPMRFFAESLKLQTEKRKVPFLTGTREIESLPGCKLEHCEGCPVGLGATEKAGLLWIGAEHYPTPAAFRLEAETQGISRRIATVPNGFEVGKTQIFLAHSKAIKTFETEDEPAGFIPGVFKVFIPQRIEYVVKDDESPEKLQEMAGRGISLIKVEKVKL